MSGINECDWRRTTLRAGEHAGQRCVSAREPCPEMCGRLVSKAGERRGLNCAVHELHYPVLTVVFEHVALLTH